MINTHHNPTPIARKSIELSISRFACSDDGDASAETSSFDRLQSSQDPKSGKGARETRVKTSPAHCIFKYYTVVRRLSAC